MAADKAPKRIQRKRTKGWKMPPNTVYVGRPTKWGNPFTVEFLGRDKAIELFRMAAQGYWSPSVVSGMPASQQGFIYGRAHRWREKLGRHPLELIPELRGKDLACWCPLDQPCHADVLLEIANGGGV